MISVKDQVIYDLTDLTLTLPEVLGELVDMGILESI